MGGFVLFALGAATARPISWYEYVIAQLMITTAQVTAHYVNEYADYEADMTIANRTSFSGGSGVLVGGELSRHVALYAGVATTVACLVFAAVVATFSITAATCGLVALGISWAYSMPPVRLLDTGLGELATAITVAGLVPLTGALSQQSVVADQLWWMMAMLIPVQIVMLLSFELPDIETDGAAGKKVLAVRIGYKNTLAVMTLLTVISIWIATVSSLSASQIEGYAIGIPMMIATLLAGWFRKHTITTLCGVASFFLMTVGLLIATL